MVIDFLDFVNFNANGFQCGCGVERKQMEVRDSHFARKVSGKHLGIFSLQLQWFYQALTVEYDVLKQALLQPYASPPDTIPNSATRQFLFKFFPMFNRPLLHAVHVIAGHLEQPFVVVGWTLLGGSSKASLKAKPWLICICSSD